MAAFEANVLVAWMDVNRKLIHSSGELLSFTKGEYLSILEDFFVSRFHNRMFLIVVVLVLCPEDQAVALLAVPVVDEGCPTA